MPASEPWLKTSEAARRLRSLRAVQAGRLYALDGNRYFARPAPSLAVGAAVLARVIHDGQAPLVQRLEALGFLPPEGEAWCKVAAAPVSRVARAACSLMSVSGKAKTELK